jgi:ABC-2 type transport system ATP-binding protein
MPGVVNFRQTPEGALLQVESEAVSQEILQRLSGKGFIRKFALEEPSLNDIFIEKVGKAYE